jgi:hypothetical protein
MLLSDQPPTMASTSLTGFILFFLFGLVLYQ